MKKKTITISKKEYRGMVETIKLLNDKIKRLKQKEKIDTDLLKQIVQSLKDLKEGKIRW